MGIYAEKATAILQTLSDRSYLPPEVQLLWRLEELTDRLEELTERQVPYSGGYRLTDEELSLASPESLTAPADLKKAIRLGVRELREAYGIPIGSAKKHREEYETISLFELLSLTAANGARSA